MTDDTNYVRERPSGRTDRRLAESRLERVRSTCRWVAVMALTAAVVLGPVAGVVSPAAALAGTGTEQAPEIGIESDADATVEQGEDATLTAYPRNNGNDDKTGIELKLLVDTDDDGTFESDESVASTAIDLDAGGSETVDLTYADVGLDPGEYATRFRAVHDGNTYDNYADGTLTVEGDGKTPTAEFTVDRSGPVVTVTAAGSGDPDGSIESYEWDFGDGTTATGVTATRTYEEPGNYTITLTITDDDGRTATAERELELGEDDETDGKPDLRSTAYGETKTGYVDEEDPAYDGFLSGQSGRGIRYEPVTFTGEAGDIVQTVGDDQEGDRTVTTQMFRGSEQLEPADSGGFVLPADGEYTIRVAFLTRANTPGELGEYTLSLRRQGGEAPAVTYEVRGDPGVDNQVTFVAEASGDDAIESYEWDFGDGTTTGGKEFDFTFQKAGEVAVEVTVTDDDGDTGSFERPIQVETELVNRFDEDDDGLELDELRDALEVVQSDDYEGGVTVREVREAIHERTVEDPKDPPDGDYGVDVDDDGLPDKLEEEGIPVLRANVTEYADVAGSPDVVEREDDLPFVVRLDTDPLSEDTDGDGLEDGQELKRVVVPPSVALLRWGVDREVVYYTMLSDPTDPNSDDTGLEDGDEARIGSDPMEPEYASVNVVVPVTGVAPTECDVSDDQIDDCAKDFDSGDLTGLRESPSHVLRPAAQSSGGADWLSEVETEESKTYFLVEVGVDFGFANLTDEERPKFMEFTGLTGSNAKIVGQGPSRGEITPGYAPPLPEDGGTKQVFVVIETGESFGVKNIGQLQARVDVPENSPVRRDGDGETAVASTETPLVIKNDVAFTSTGEAQQMVEEASRKWAQGTITVVAPSGGAVAKLAARSGAGSAAAELVVEGVATLSGTTDEGLLSKPGQDELIAQAIVGEGSAPGYTNRNLDTPPISNTAVVWYRES